MRREPLKQQFVLAVEQKQMDYTEVYTVLKNVAALGSPDNLIMVVDDVD